MKSNVVQISSYKRKRSRNNIEVIMNAAYYRQQEPEKKREGDFKRAVSDVLYLICREKSIERIHVIAYLFRHSIYYQEYRELKHITLDEFVNGRRKREGGRMDDGCGIKKRPNVSTTLNALEKDNIVLVDEEGNDRARIKKRYGLNLPSIYAGYPTDNSEPEEDETVIPQITQGYPTDNSELSHRYPSVIPEITRSVVNTPSKSFKKIPLVKGGDEVLKNEEDERTNTQAIENQETAIIPVAAIEKLVPPPPASQDKRAAIAWQVVKDRINGNGGISPAAYDNWISRTEGWAMQDGVLWVAVNGSGTRHAMENRFGAAVRIALRQVLPDFIVAYFVPAGGAA